mmetsp:Transcript_13380/g.32503  ORF Transcript_13380/g.32503 Transcript_13380/m.32503 type:complete len:235 (+) Transcript_13380:74-778(+)
MVAESLFRRAAMKTRAWGSRVATSCRFLTVARSFGSEACATPLVASAEFSTSWRNALMESCSALTPTVFAAALSTCTFRPLAAMAPAASCAASSCPLASCSAAKASSASLAVGSTSGCFHSVTSSSENELSTLGNVGSPLHAHLGPLSSSSFPMHSHPLAPIRSREVVCALRAPVAAVRSTKPSGVCTTPKRACRASPSERTARGIAEPHIGPESAPTRPLASLVFCASAERRM